MNQTHRYVAVYMFVVVAGASGCSLSSFARDGSVGFSSVSCADAEQADDVTVFLINLGWHTGVAIPTTTPDGGPTIPIPEMSGFSWVEFGWGDEGFYRASGYSVWQGLKAAFFSSGAVLHSVGFDEAPKEFFSESEVVEIRLSRTGFVRLLQVLSESLYRDGKGAPVSMGKSLYGHGHFYRAMGSFSLLHTCNSWVSDLLAEAGCPVTRGSVRASSIVRDLEQNSRK